VVEQMSGNWKIRATNLIPLWTQAQEIAQVFKSVKYTHIDRSLNSEADRLANMAIESACNPQKFS
jgi:ribonuclease HI